MTTLLVVVDVVFVEVVVGIVVEVVVDVGFVEVFVDVVFVDVVFVEIFVDVVKTVKAPPPPPTPINTQIFYPNSNKTQLNLNFKTPQNPP